MGKICRTEICDKRKNAEAEMHKIGETERERERDCEMGISLQGATGGVRDGARCAGAPVRARAPVRALPHCNPRKMQHFGGGGHGKLPAWKRLQPRVATLRNRDGPQPTKVPGGGACAAGQVRGEGVVTLTLRTSPKSKELGAEYVVVVEM